MPQLNLAQNSRNPKIGQITPRLLAVQPVPPGASSAILEKCQDVLRRLAAVSVPLGGSSSRNPEHMQCMSRLAIVHRLPGGFWKIPETHNFQGFNSAITINISYRYTLLIIRIKSRSPAPLTWFSFA